MADIPVPYVNIQIGHINNNQKFYIKKGTIVNVNDIDINSSNVTPITLYNNDKHRITNWGVMEQEPDYTYNDVTKMWSLKGLNNKYEAYFVEIPEEALEWINHMSDFTFEMTLNITDDTTLKGDGTTGDIASLFSWRNLYEDAVDGKPEWPTSQEFIKLNRGDRDYTFGNDNFYKSINNDKNLKYSELNKIYWRYEIEPYKDFYPEGNDFDGDFKYPNADDIRICRGWKKNIIDNKDDLDVVKRFILSNDLYEKYKNDWDINNCDRVQTPNGNKIRIKLFTDKEGDVLKKYVFKDIKISITNSYYTYYKNISNLQDLSVQSTNNIFKHWSNINYRYSMFTRKTEKIGNTTIQNSGTKITNRLSQMQRMWIAFSGGKSLKSSDGKDFFITDVDNKIGRSKIINTISPIQQLLWIAWHLNNSNGSWKSKAIPNYKNGKITADDVNYFITQFLWSWQTLLEIMPLSNNNLNTDIEFSELGTIDTNKQTYYNKNFFFEVIKELKGWPMPIIKSVSEMINDWIPPMFTLNINNDTQKLNLLSSDINEFNEAQSIITNENRLNLFYTIPSNTIFDVDNYLNYKGPYSNNHSMNFINLTHFVNRLNYDKNGNGWFSKQGFIDKFSIPIAGKNNNNERIISDDNYMYRINDTPKRNNIRGITRNIRGDVIDGTLRKHNGIIVKLPETFSKYSIPWDPINYVPKITKIRIELDFSIRQSDENIALNKFLYSSILSTNYDKPLVFLSSTSKRRIMNADKDNGWKHSGLLHANSENISLDRINFLNVPKISNNISRNINSQEEFLDNGRYRLIYEIDNLPVMNPGEQIPKFDPLKSGLLVQIDYSKSDTQKKYGIKTIRGGSYIATNGQYYDGNNGKANYSISPDRVGSIFKDDGPFSFSVHKNNMYGLMSHENTKKHLGFYLFTGEYSSSSYYFKDVKVELEIPELELEKIYNESKGKESNLKISNLDLAIKKADKFYPGVVDRNLLLQAKKKLSIMKILIDVNNVENLESTPNNIDTISLSIDNLINVDINDDDDYYRKIELQNTLEIMKKHLEFKNIVNKDSTIKEINDILVDINTENIDEKYIFTDLTTNVKEEKIRKVSLKNKRNITEDETKLIETRKKLISDYTIELNVLENKYKKDMFGDGILGQFILLKNKLHIEHYNKGELSVIVVDDTKLTPIEHLNNADKFFSNIKQDWLNELNVKIIESSKRANLDKLIDYVLKSETEQISTFTDGSYGLEGKYFEATRKIKNTIDELKSEWLAYKKNNIKKEVWFNWLGDLPPDSSWKSSISLNILEIKQNKEYVERIIQNLNLKIANDFSVPIKIINKDKGKINAKEHKIKFPVDPEIYVNKSTQALRVNWITNKYTESFVKDIWIGVTEDLFKKTSNILGQKDPGSTPLGSLMKRIENNSNSFLRLVTIAKNGSPNKDQWHFPGINNINIDDSRGTSSYPDLNNSNNGNYLKEGQQLAYPPGPLQKLVDYMENDLEMIEDYHSYKNEKKLYYHNSIWMYEYALKYDTNDLQKINFWIDLSTKHGLSQNNIELRNVKDKLKNFKDKVLNKLNDITIKQQNGFLKDDFTNLPLLKKELEVAKSKFIDDSFDEFLKARQLLFEHEEILKNRVKSVTINSNINTGLRDLDIIIETAKGANFNNYDDAKPDKTGIIDIYNQAIERQKSLAKEIEQLISVELIRKTITRLDIQNPNDIHYSLDATNIDTWEAKDIDINALRSQIAKMERLRGNTKSEIQIKSENKLAQAIEYRNNELLDAITKSNLKDSLAKDLNNSINTATRIGLLNTNTIVIKAKNKVNEMKKRNLNSLVDVKMASLNKIGHNNSYSNWVTLNKKINDTVNDLIPDDNIDIVTSKISLTKILDDLKKCIGEINTVITEKKEILNRKNTDVTVEMIQDSIIDLERQKNIINDKELLNINKNLFINIETSIGLFNIKRRNVFRRPVNGLYYNYNNNNKLLLNGTLNKNIFIGNDNSIDIKILHFICSNINHNIGSKFKRVNDETLIRNKLFLSINDIVYLPTNSKFIVNNIGENFLDKDIAGGSIILKARSEAGVLQFYVNYKCHEHNYQTSKKMNYARHMSGFLFPASSINKKHNYQMNRRQINTNIKNLSQSGRQSRLQANTGSLSRLQRLKAKHM